MERRLPCRRHRANSGCCLGRITLIVLESHCARFRPADARYGCGILALMLTFRTHGRRWWLVAIAAVLFATLAALLLKPMLEQAVRARIEAAAVSHGMVARIGQVHVGVWPFVRLERFDLDAGHGVQLHADAIAATWPGGCDSRFAPPLSRAPGMITVSSPASAWDIEGIRGGDLVAHAGGASVGLVDPQTRGFGKRLERRDTRARRHPSARCAARHPPAGRCRCSGRPCGSSDQHRCTSFPRRHERARSARAGLSR